MAARSLNKVLLIGNLTRDPEMRYTGNGTPVVTFGLATNKSWKDQSGEVQESVQYHNIVAWNKMAEICQQLLSKGMKIYIEGEINTRSWEDEAGGTKYKTEIRINDMILLDGKGKSGAGMSAASAQSDDDGLSAAAPAKKSKKATDQPADDADVPMEDADPLSDEDLPF
ncbi:MAG: single-stranded DNA-binding protein [Candidatus Dojkabacteria bacterium]